jgi:hypothetical protein
MLFASTSLGNCFILYYYIVQCTITLCIKCCHSESDIAKFTLRSFTNHTLPQPEKGGLTRLVDRELAERAMARRHDVHAIAIVVML